jgi:hypothetical protein
MTAVPLEVAILYHPTVTNLSKTTEEMTNPRARVLLGKLRVAHLLKKLPAFYET